MKLAENSALILVDVQNSIKDPIPTDAEGIREYYKRHTKFLGDSDLDSIVEYYANAQKNIKYFRDRKIPIVHVIELHRDDLVDFGRELDGSEHVHCLEGDSMLWEGCGMQEGEYLIPKRRYSAFFDTDLNLLLKGLKVKHLYIVGCMTDICVHYTSVHALQLNYDITVLRELCDTHSPKGVIDSVFKNLEYIKKGSTASIYDLPDFE